MVFEYEVYAVDQLAGNFHDGLARYHPLAVVQVAELHRFILADGYPGCLNDVAAQDGMLSESNVPDTFMLTA